MLTACVMMQRNEVNALEPWIKYHAALFGLENLYVIDHGSDKPELIAMLAAYEKRGLRVFRLSAKADYRLKGEFVSQILKVALSVRPYEFVFPLDCDEFLALRTEEGLYSCEPEAISGYLRSLVGMDAVFEVKENLLNILGAPGKFLDLPYQKVFFSGKNCGVVDHGSHQDVSGQPKERVPTRFVYLHFHHKPYRQQVAASLEKLQPYMNIKDQAELERFRGTGWHLIEHILKGEAYYNEMMHAMCIGPGGVHVKGLIPCFQALGINPLFTEH